MQNNGKITLYWDPEFKEKAKQYAEDKGTSVSALAKKLVECDMKEAMEVTVTLPNDVVSIVQNYAVKEGLPFIAALETVVTRLIRKANEA